MANQETIQLNFDESTTAGIEGAAQLGIELERLFRAIYEDLSAREVQEDKHHANMSAEDNSTPTSLAVSGTWYQVVIFNTNGETNGAAPDHTNDHIAVDRAGTYMVTVSASILSMSGSAFTLEGEVKSNNGTVDHTNIHFDRKFGGGGGDVGSISMSGTEVLAVGDTVEFWVRNKTNTTGIIVEDVSLQIVEM